MTASLSSDARTFDVQPVLDRQRRVAPHLPLLVLMTLIMLVDGYDVFMIGKIAPAMAADLGEPIANLTLVFVLQQMGLAVGSFLVGPLSDRHGRRTLLILCTLVFGVLTLAPVWASSLTEVAIYRGAAGLFLAGVIPNAAAMLTETAPPRWRASFVSIAFTGFTAGGAGGALMAMWLLDRYGWEIGFWIGGLVPLMLAPIFALSTDEPLQFRVRRNPADPHIRRALLRMEPDLDLARIERFRLGEDKPSSGKGSGGDVRAIFSEGRTPITLLLWLAYFIALGLIAFLGAWMASFFLEMAHVPLSRWAAYSLLSFVGGLAGTTTVGFLMDRLGRVRVLVALFLVDAAALLLMGTVPFGGAAFIVVTLVWGYCQAGGQGGLNAICAQVYPTSVRASGVGWAFGMGRVGGIVMPVIGGLMLGAHASLFQVFLLISAFPLVVALALVGIGRIERQQAGS